MGIAARSCILGVGLIVGWGCHRRDEPVAIAPDPPTRPVAKSSRASAIVSTPVAPSSSTFPPWVEDSEVYPWPSVPPKKNEIVRVDDTHFMADRGYVETSLEHMGEWMKTFRMIPVLDADGGRAGGLKILGLKKKSPIGVENGDVLDSINGRNLGGPEDLLEVYSHLRTSRRLVLALDRPAKRIEIHYLITGS
jgi:hypothetical protein